MLLLTSVLQLCEKSVGDLNKKRAKNSGQVDCSNVGVLMDMALGEVYCRRQVCASC